MTNNLIKKRLYREKPTAFKVGTTGPDGEIWVYDAHLPGLSMRFVVPIKDMGEKLFEEQLPAQLLIRWLDKVR